MTIKARFIKHTATLGLLLALGWLGTTAAVSAQNINIGSYTNDPELKPGMVVSLTAESRDGRPVVERADSARAGQIIGVAVGRGEGLISVGSSDAQIYVVTSGEVDAYVSDYNGSVKAGDSLVISPIRGVMMAAKEDEKGLGTALTDLDAATADTVSVKVNGQTQTKRFGKIKVALDVDSSQATRGDGSFIDRIGDLLIRQDISLLRLVSAVIILIILLIIEGSLIHGAVSSAVTSLGRNPLSHKMVYKVLLHSAGLALAILVAGIAAIFAIIWL